MCAFGHLAAFFGTPTTGFGTLPTVVHVTRVFFALSRTGFADMGAKLADIGRMRAAGSHERNGCIADFGTIAVESDTVYHHLYVLLTEAGLRAGITGNSTSLTGFDAHLVLLRN